MDRRTFSRSVGLGTLFAPFLSLLREERARAQIGPAKYLCIFFTNGTDPAAWSPVGSSESSLSFSRMTEPLAPLRENLILVEGLSSRGTADNHGAPGGLTGKGYSDFDHLSLDQFVSDRLRAAGVETPIPSLLLGGVRSQQQTSFWRDGRVLSPIFSPVSAYETVFASAAPDAGGGAPPSERLRRRQSALDLVRAELGQLSDRLGVAERQKLELHAESIRQLERRLADAMQGNGGGGSCPSPTMPMEGSEDLRNSELHLDLAVTAFACDVTRVAAVQFGHHQATQVSLPEVGTPGDWHSSFLHGDNPRTRLENLERWLAERFVAAAEKMKSLPAPDGAGTLFDQTLFVWARDMGDAVAHSAEDMRFVITGGAGGYLRKSPNGVYLNASGSSHQQVLLNCCEALGITDFNGFGHPSGDRTALEAVRS